MRVYGFVGQKRGTGGFIDALLSALDNRLPRPLVNALLSGKPDSISPQNDAIASDELHRSLRHLVDGWIDSGRNELEDRPWMRTIDPEPLQEYINRNPPRLEVGSTGPFLVVEPQRSYEEGGLVIAAKDVATAMFIQLLDSPERTQLSRCDGCSRHFLRTRAPKSTPIYHGTWCMKCKAKRRNSVRHTERRRRDETDRMVGWAAEASLRWTPRCHEERKAWILKKLNEQLVAHRLDLRKMKWVTQHMQKIEAEAARRKHGTQKAR
jgi:hypothetical protein